MESVSLLNTMIQNVKESFCMFFDGIIKRKLLSGVISYLIALICIRNDLWILCILVLLIYLIFLFFSIKSIRLEYVTETGVYLIVFFIFGALIMNYAQSKASDINNMDYITLQGSVIDREKLEYSDRYTVKIDSSYFLCYLYTEPDISKAKIGDKIYAEGTVVLFESPSNDGCFDAVSYYLSRNIRFSIDVDNFHIVNSSSFSFVETLRSFREIIAVKIDTYMSDNSGLLKAILLGDKTDIGEYEKELYQRGGISHILAISGLHVSNLSIIICFFLGKSGIPKNVSVIVSVIFLFVYAVFSGFSSSVVRAVIMFGISNTSMLLAKDYDVPTAMSLSFFIYTLFYPYSYSSPGTVLSYAAIFSIWLYSVNYKRFHKVKYENRIHNFIDQKILKTLYMSLFLFIFSLPLVLNYFYTIPVYSVIVNMYVVPVMAVLFMTSITAVLFSFVNGTIASFLFKICSILISSFTSIVDLSVDELNGIMVPGKPHIIEIVFFYAVLLLILVVFAKFKRKYMLMSLLVIPLIFIMTKGANNSITMIDVDQGECSVITTEAGDVFMIDCGSTGESNIFKYTVEPYLLANGIDRIDYVFLSHSDMDHVNGIIEYMQKRIDTIEISNIVITTQMYKDEDIAEKIINVANKKGINIKLMKASDKIMCRNTVITCMHPAYDTVSDDVNKDSMVLKIEIDGLTALFTGDISEEIEEQLPAFDTDILKVAHHGSKTGTCEKFLNIINPEIALISCGVGNNYGHPAQIVLDNLSKYNVKTYISANYGQTRIFINNSDYRITTIYRN